MFNFQIVYPCMAGGILQKIVFLFTIITRLVYLTKHNSGYNRPELLQMVVTRSKVIFENYLIV